MTELDLVFRAHRVITASGEVNRCVGVRDGEIVAIEPYDSPLTAPTPTGRPCRIWTSGATDDATVRRQVRGGWQGGDPGLRDTETGFVKKNAAR
ncbi:hypothetical protein ACQP04_36100 [Pseudonocardia halophobica]|uniref:hypothetical protein n=1 Tax=Pseudonocardia halophobica TaxID=29401 RepID=UPI003D8D3313